MNKNVPPSIGAQVEVVLRFDQFYARRLHDEEKAEAVDRDLNLLQRQVLRELLLRPCPCVFLSWRLDVDPGYLSRALRYLELVDLVTLSTEKEDRRQRRATPEVYGRDPVKNIVDRMIESRRG